MEIIAQASVGLSRFLHPDYLSASTQSFKIDFFDGIFTQTELLLTTCSIAGFIILCVLIAYFVNIKRNRF